MSNFQYVLSHCEGNSKLKVFSGSLPVFIFTSSVVLLFTTSNWAGENPGLASLFFAPAFSMISSKQIVCNFTKMDLDPFPKSFLWTFAFLVNRVATLLSLSKFKLFALLNELCIEGDLTWTNLMALDDDKLLVQEWMVALAVFTINLVWYMIFVTCTIDQICRFLNIHCLTIKHKK